MARMFSNFSPFPSLNERLNLWFVDDDLLGDDFVNGRVGGRGRGGRQRRRQLAGARRLHRRAENGAAQGAAVLGRRRPTRVRLFVQVPHFVLKVDQRFVGQRLVRPVDFIIGATRLAAATASAAQSAGLRRR